MTSVLVTGATGLIGSAVCAELARRGDTVRALVRPQSDAAALTELGVDVVRGDIVSRQDVRRAAESCEYCIHTAALVTGGPVYPDEEYERVNVLGSAHVFDAAADVGMKRVVSFASGPDPRRTPARPDAFPGDPYFSTKLLVSAEVMRRSERGQEILEISPGAVFGPAPSGRRAVTPPGFNSRIVLALRGELRAMPAFQSSFVLAADVARTTLPALRRGKSGERYSLGGRPEERVDSVEFLNMACERAGVAGRVRAMTIEELARDEALARFGPTIVALAKAAARGGPPPATPHRRTPAMEVLGHDPTPLRPSVDQTVDWMVMQGLVTP